MPFCIETLYDGCMTATMPEASSLLLTLRRQTAEVHRAREAAHTASRARFLTIARLRGLGISYRAIGGAMGLTSSAAQRLVEQARERHPELMTPPTPAGVLGAGTTLKAGAR
ncbi:Uncharacterised protein [Mycobacteroides abscessus subsp. abscessus]|nr:Uncharacterised protein [Mycobacteroides abscessus subsp. abscessus]SHQ61459.1 Uncharacterised protein [Mycobacteroides abscessus subsp. abscessus]SKD63106.1 Uncharacterised protein [Mycobacteroides abscessus subsp. abscessus]SLD63213.1 Uncharacterised protein [Mycobacteroides abscessus subsp. abscessus]